MDETKILSWDVGIINLAYCLIKKKGDNFSIEKWGIINLNDEVIKCNAAIRCNKTCTSNAKYSLATSDETKYLCARHRTSYKPEIIEGSLENITGVCCYLVNNEIKCTKKAIGSIKSSLYCKSHYGSKLKSMQKECLPKKLNQSCNIIPMQTLSVKLQRKLDEIKDFMNVDEVLIENQPSFKNPTMKTISSMLYSYFTIRGIVDVKTTNSTIKNVKFFSPSNKLKVGGDKTKKTLEKGENERHIYEITKTLGKNYCLALIKDDKENLAFVTAQSKKDDLCDSFLQGFYYLFCINGVPEKYANILKQLNELDTTNKKGKKITVPGKGLSVVD
jgi:hypothetical protein